MNLKTYNQYQMDMKGRWIHFCGVMMSCSFFLRIVYYFGLKNLRDIPGSEIFATMIAGLVLCAGFVVVLNYLRLNAPGIYGILGCAHCLLLIIGNFSGGSVGRIILSVIWYVLCALVLLATIAGYLPGRLLSAGMFFLTALVRLFAYDLGKIDLLRWVTEGAVLCVILALAAIPMALKPVKEKTQ